MSDRPDWDDEAAGRLIGRIVLIGLTYRGAADDSRRQMYGEIVSADARRGIEVELHGTRSGETYWLPPHLDAVRPAAPGRYQLYSTHEVVVNPDFISTWLVDPPNLMQ